MIHINHWALWKILPCRLSTNLHSYWWNFIHNYFNLCGYLSPPTRLLKVTVITLSISSSQACIICVLITQFSIWIWDPKPAGIWTRISTTKSSYANHWATLHWLHFIFCLYSVFAHEFLTNYFFINHNYFRHEIVCQIKMWAQQ